MAKRRASSKHTPCKHTCTHTHTHLVPDTHTHTHTVPGHFHLHIFSYTAKHIHNLPSPVPPLYPPPQELESAVAKRRASTKRKLAVLQQEGEALVADARARIQRKRKQAGKLPQLAALLRQFV